MIDYVQGKNKFLELIKRKQKPYKLEFYFIRDSKRRFDYINACQLPLDLMQKHGWIDDDDSKHVIPSFAGFEVNKEQAGMIIKVL